MSERSTRIRWNQEERNAILAAYQRLRAQDPKRGVAELFSAAQKELPPQRRRALDHKLRVWLASGSNRAPRRTPAATAAATLSPLAAPAAGRKRRQNAPPPAATTAPKPSPPQGARAATSVPPGSAAVAKAIVELGSEIVADILESARVQHALRALLRAVWPAPASDAPTRQPVAPAGADPAVAAPSAPDTGAPHASVPTNGKLRVLIAGMEQREGAILAKTYDDTLELVCWSAEDGPELLPAAVARADVVVGMTGVLSQPVEQTLRRHAKRYVRNARGVSGLRSELAGLALSGNAAAIAGA